MAPWGGTPHSAGGAAIVFLPMIGGEYGELQSRSGNSAAMSSSAQHAIVMQLLDFMARIPTLARTTPPQVPRCFTTGGDCQLAVALSCLAARRH